ncbi:MAG: hypothetical protein ACOCSK_01080 [Rhodothermales bacterium]
MPDLDALIEKLSAIAVRWREPDHDARVEAVRRTLEADNRFTAEATAFAINQQMDQITPDALRSWLGGRRTRKPLKVGVLNAGNVPLAGLQDFLAVVLTGHAYAGSTSSKSPFLLPEFAREVSEGAPALEVDFLPYDQLLGQVEAVIATGSDETRMAVGEDLDRAGVPASRRLLRGHRYSVAVLDGLERSEEREGLAEDALLHEGMGCRNVAVVWAPRGISPDPYLDAMAQFRSVFPAHVRTPAALKMHRAMLEAVDVPHAYGEGLEFLVSKGEPEPQAPGHIRWAEYTNLSEVEDWIARNRESLQIVVCRRRLPIQMAEEIESVEPGCAQRPSLSWRPEGVDTIDFLARLPEVR